MCLREDDAHSVVVCELAFACEEQPRHNVSWRFSGRILLQIYRPMPTSQPRTCVGRGLTIGTTALLLLVLYI
jgi:hypothetical protein